MRQPDWKAGTKASQFAEVSNDVYNNKMTDGPALSDHAGTRPSAPLI